MWQHWVSGVLGLWVIVMALMGLQELNTVVVTGATIAIVGFWGAFQESN